MVSQCPVDEFGCRADEGAVVVHRIGVVDGQQHLAVEAIDAAAIAQDAVVDLLAVDQLLQCRRDGVVGHDVS